MPNINYHIFSSNFMKLLVTGGLGFIGSNFILKILNEKQKNSVVNVDAELFGSNHQNLESVKNHENYILPAWSILLRQVFTMLD